MNFNELLDIQAKFEERIEYKPSRKEYILAIRTEMFELYNATEVNKWWKQNKGKGKEAILDECADVMAFCFSFANQLEIKNEIDSHYKTLGIYWIYAKENFEQGLLTSFKTDFQEEYYIMQFIVIVLGNSIQFTKFITKCSDDEIINAYKKKMTVNHQRQDENY